MLPFLITPYNTEQSTHAWWDGAFNDEELDFLQLKAKAPTQVAKIGNGNGSGGIVADDVRRSEVSWLPCNDETLWVYTKLSHVVSTLNSRFFQFNITCFGEHFQLTHYDNSYKGMYGWHVDFGNNTSSPSRKLSVVLQLSDPVDYEGGILELKLHNNDAVKINKRRGLIVVFPSWTLHQVTPVTEGNRQSLVSWVTGPAFK